MSLLTQIKDKSALETSAYNAFSKALKDYAALNDPLPSSNPDFGKSVSDIINVSANTAANNAIWNAWGFTVAADRELLMKQVRPNDTSTIEILKTDHKTFHKHLRDNLKTYRSLNSHIKDLFFTDFIEAGYTFRIYNKYRLSTHETSTRNISAG